MAKYLTHTIMTRSLNLLRATLPLDTGNLRYNATTGIYFYSGFSLIISGDKAPYFEYLDGTGRSDQYQSKRGFEEESFAPVYSYIKSQFQGKFAGGRFLKTKDLMTYNSDLHRAVETVSGMNLSARQSVAERYGGR
jgi:hypothetical protein